VDPAKPDDVTIDWDGFLAAGGRDEMKKGNEAAGVDKLRATYPKETAQMRENATRDLPNLVAGVKGGSIKRKDFDQTLETFVRNGYLEPGEADAARAELDG
jgi:hypothetical protein